MIELHFNNKPYPLDGDGTYASLVTDVLEEIHMDLGVVDHQGEEQPELDSTPQGIVGTIALLRNANPDLNLQWRISA